MGYREAPGKLVLLDANNHPVTRPEPCVYDWLIGVGRCGFRIRSRHVLTIPEGVAAETLAITDNNGRILWAHPLLAGPLTASQQLHIDPDPAQPIVEPGREHPMTWTSSPA
jgi:hypothetical protein